MLTRKLFCFLIPPNHATWTDRGLYACGDDFGDGFLVGLSSDARSSYAPILHLPCIRGPHDCRAETSVATERPGRWPTVKAQLEQYVAATCATHAQGTCGADEGGGGASASNAPLTPPVCTVAGASAPPGGLEAMGLFAWLLRRRRAPLWIPMLAWIAVGCRADAEPKQSEPSDAGMCTVEADAGCGTEWCAEHGVPEAECVQCNPNAAVPKHR